MARTDMSVVSTRGARTREHARAMNEGAARGAYRFEEHTGEVLLRLTAPTHGELFIQAGRALAELMAGDARAGALSAPERVVVTGRDAVALLVAFVNEILYLSETRKRVYCDFQVVSVSERELDIQVRGFVPSHLRTAVKAATLHRLRIEAGPSGYNATMVLDV